MEAQSEASSKLLYIRLDEVPNIQYYPCAKCPHSRHIDGGDEIKTYETYETCVQFVPMFREFRYICVQKYCLSFTDLINIVCS